MAEVVEVEEVVEEITKVWTGCGRACPGSPGWTTRCTASPCRTTSSGGRRLRRITAVNCAPVLSSCEGRVEGGYYSDPALGCQAFHICVRVGEVELAKYSFLCPNGSLFHQTYFVCDFWFNVDCSQAEAQYGLNDAVAAEREANIGAVAPEDVLGEELL